MLNQFDTNETNKLKLLMSICDFLNISSLNSKHSCSVKDYIQIGGVRKVIIQLHSHYTTEDHFPGALLALYLRRFCIAS